MKDAYFERQLEKVIYNITFTCDFFKFMIYRVSNRYTTTISNHWTFDKFIASS